MLLEGIPTGTEIRFNTKVSQYVLLHWQCLNGSFISYFCLYHFLSQDKYWSWTILSALNSEKGIYQLSLNSWLIFILANMQADLVSD